MLRSVEQEKCEIVGIIVFISITNLSLSLAEREKVYKLGL